MKKKLHEAAEFEDWLSPEVMRLLINRYAAKDPEYGILKWEYRNLGSRTWGFFMAEGPMLAVNKAKTEGLFKQQVQTILHEIQHWNQFVDVTSGPRFNANWSPAKPEFAKNNKMVRVGVWRRAYDTEKARMGYRNCSFEMGARDFADEHLEEAMKMLGEQHYGTPKVEGGTLDEVIEELMQDYVDGGEVPLTRLQIGLALRAYNLNNAANMNKVVADLKELGIIVR